MLVFEDISLKHKEQFDKLVVKECKLNSISDFNFFYLWNTTGNIQIAFWDKYAVLKGIWNKKVYYYSPSITNFEDFDKLLKQIMQYQNGKNFYLAGLGSDIVEKIECLPANCQISFDRNASDYIYLTDDLMNLRGKKFHAKKNFVNSFTKSYQYKFAEYDKSYHQEILALYDNWTSNSDHEVDPKEKIAINTALTNHKELGLKIGLLLVDDKIVAFSASSISVHGVAQVFFEKANTDYKGIYAMINYLTANNFLSDTEFVNREEDMGIEGLRKAKLSYNPTLIFEKYILEYKA